MIQQELVEESRGRALTRLITAIFTPRRVVHSALALALLAAAADLPNRWATIESTLPVTRLWSDPDAQYRAQIAFAPHDLLRAADAALPHEATVLLVTSGQDVARREYTTYHRALYLLAPRAVWWMSPAPSDGSWKSRWWISAPLTPDSIRSIAAEKGADYVLAYDISPPVLLGRKVADFGDGYLLQIDESAPFISRPDRQEYASIVWPLQVAFALIVIMLLGSLALTAVSRLGYSPRGVEAWALAWACGAGLTTVAMFWLNALGLSLRSQIAVLTLLAVGWALWRLVVFDRKKQGQQPKYQEVTATAQIGDVARTIGDETTASTHWHTALRSVLLFFLAAHVLVVVVMAIAHPLYVWDSWVNWGMKARMIFLEDGITPALYTDASRIVTHLDYPLLVPLSEAWFYGWLGAPDDRFAGVPSVCFYLALVGVCYAAVYAVGVGHTTALAASVVVATISFVGGVAGIVFADIQLALFATITAVYLVKWLQGEPLGTLIIASLGAGLLTWTKREGLVLLLAICLATLVINLNRRRAWAGAGSLALSAALISGPWWALISLNHVVNAAFMPLTLTNFLGNLDRLPTIAMLERNSLLNSGWNLIWPMSLLVGLLTWRQARRSMELLPAVAVLYILMTGIMYIFSDFVPYDQHIVSSVNRLAVHVVPLVVLWMVMRGQRRAVGV